MEQSTSYDEQTEWTSISDPELLHVSDVSVYWWDMTLDNMLEGGKRASTANKANKSNKSYSEFMLLRVFFFIPIFMAENRQCRPEQFQ